MRLIWGNNPALRRLSHADGAGAPQFTAARENFSVSL
jgi:hypothetical protein